MQVKTHIYLLTASSLVVLLSGFFIYARIFPHSIFSFYWDDLSNEAKKDFAARMYLQSFQDLHDDVFATLEQQQEAADLCIAIPSADRDTPYIYRSLASITLAAQQATLARTARTIAVVVDVGLSNTLCDALENFSQNTRLNCISRTQAIPAAANDGSLLRMRAEQTADKFSSNWEQRERTDYALALHWCLANTKAPFLTVLQDDGIFARDGISRAVSAAHELNSTSPQFAALQLYSSDFWKGFEDKHIGIFCALGILGAATCGTLAFKHTRGSKQSRRFRIAVIYALFGAFWFVFLPLLVGKQHLPFVGTRTFGGVVQSAMEGPGIVAYLYPRKFAEELVFKLTEPCLAGCEVDLFVDAIVRGRGGGFELLPNVVDHAGFVSSNRNKRFNGDWFRPHHVRSGSFRKSSGSPF